METVQYAPTGADTEAPQGAPQGPPIDTKKLTTTAQTLISKWKEEEKCLESNRNLRKLDYTEAQLIQMKVIKDDETFIGFRVIDENILREIPTFLKYLGGSARQLVFKPLDQASDFPVDVVETAFTAYVRTQNWQIPFYNAYDSAALHGRGIVEVIPNPTQPCGLGTEFIEVEDFIFPLTARQTIQTQPMVARRYRWNAQELRDNSKLFEFEPGETKKVLDQTDETTEVSKVFEVFKLFFRVQTQVYCAWYSPLCTDYLLKKPYPHSDGKFDITGTAPPAMLYPFFMLLYRMGEDQLLIGSMGRGKLDKYNQEGQCSLGTSFINGVKRACNIYPSVDTTSTDTSAIEGIAPLTPGQIMSRPITFNNFPYPDPIVPQAITLLSGRNSQSTGQVDYAAKNRQDSRKTATEIDAAQEQRSELSGISTFSLSQWLLGVFAFYWEVMQFNATNDPSSTFLVAAGPMREMLLKARYNLLPAGDIDYVERQQKLDAMLKYWPIVANTPAAMPFFKKLMMLALPDEAQEILGSLQGDPQVSMGQALANVVANLPRKQLLDLVPDNVRPQLNQIIDEAIAALGPDAGRQSGIQSAPNADQAGAGNGAASVQQPQPRQSKGVVHPASVQGTSSNKRY